MSRGYSLDLRTRLVECVEAGASRHEAGVRNDARNNSWRWRRAMRCPRFLYDLSPSWPAA